MIKLKDIADSHPKLRLFLLGLWLLMTFGFVAYKGGIKGWNNTTTDFNNYYVSAVLVAKGESISTFYNNENFSDRAKELGVENGAKFAPFPPLTAFLYLPLSGFDLLTAKRIWLIFNCLLLAVLPFRLKRIFKSSLPTSLLVTSLFFIPLSSNLNFGQAYLFLTCLIIEAIGLAWRHNQKNIAALLVSICALLKYLPVLFLLYFFKSNSADQTKSSNLKWIAVFLISTISILLISHLAYPAAYPTFLSTFTHHLQGDLSGQGKFAIGFQSLDSLLNNLFVYDAVQNPSPFMAVPILKPILKITVLTLIGIICFVLFKRDRYRFNPLNTSLFIIGAFTLIPASASYHFLFLIVPVLLIYQWLSTADNWRSLVIFILLIQLAFFIQYHHIPNFKSTQTFNLIIHYPRLWSLFILFGYLSFLNLHRKNG